MFTRKIVREKCLLTQIISGVIILTIAMSVSYGSTQLEEENIWTLTCKDANDLSLVVGDPCSVSECDTSCDQNVTNFARVFEQKNV